MWQLYLITGLFGALIGSFLNVCIYRLPRRESVVWPGSHCPACSKPIAWYDNVPILGYLILAGRCRACSIKISLQYPVVEALNAAGYLAMLWYFGPTAEAVVYAVLFSALLVVSGTDLSHKIIPNVITFPGIVMGLVSAATILPLGLLNGLIGLLVGGGLLWLATSAQDDGGAAVIRAQTVALGGHATLVRAPDAVRVAVPVFEPEPAPLAALSARVKDAFDPKRVLNPGRMFAGV